MKGHTNTFETILQLSGVVKLEDSSQWYKKEVCGKLLLVGDKYQYFKEPAIKVI